MHQNKAKMLAAQLVELARRLQDGDAMQASTRSTSFRIGDKHVGFVDSDAERCQELFNEIYQESGWSDKYSEGYSDNLFRTVLVELLDTNTTAAAEAAIAKLAFEYSAYQKRHSVLIPLFGITLHVPMLTVGRVTIICPSISDLALRLGTSMTMLTGQLAVKCLNGKVLAAFEAVAEPIRAKEMAVEETRRALEVLRYAIPFLYEGPYKYLKLNVSIEGDHPNSDSVAFIVPSCDAHSLTFTSENTRPAILVQINEENVKKLGECGALEVASLLAKPLAELTDIDRVLLRGLHWFGNALCHGEPENELLSLTTCLETFLTPKDGNPIGTAIAEGIAILLADNLEERKRLKKRVKDLYSKRSGVSHGGEKAVLESDLVTLRDIAKRLIHKVITLRDKATSQRRCWN